MSKIRHQLFKIKVTNGTIYPNQKVFSEINDFLEKGNHIYVNHSITTIFKSDLINTSGNKDIKVSNPPHNGFFKYEVNATYLIVSLIYKDLSDYGEDVSGLKEESKNLITKNVIDEMKVEKPNFETEIDIKNK